MDFVVNNNYNRGTAQSMFGEMSGIIMCLQGWYISGKSRGSRCTAAAAAEKIIDVIVC